MKIGILTYHRAENYGALLQAYGLKIYLSSLGHDVSFVDYWPEYHQKYHKILRMDKILYGSLKEKLVSIYNVLFWGMFRYRRRRNLQRFMHEHLGLTQNPLYSKDNDIVKGYDCVVYGSDQIWRKQSQISDIGFNSWYFGSDNIITPVKIAYAASMGQILCSEDDNSYLIKYLGGFSHLSVREQDLKEKLNTLGFHPELVCDPVFLLPKEEWRKIFSPQEYKEKYILVYNLLSMKRSAMLAMALIWIMFFFILYFKGDKRKKGGICVVTILASILSYYIFQSVDKSVGGELSERVNTEETENTGRPLIWATTWVMIHDCSPQQLILGNGHYGVKRDSFLELSAHNEYLETLYDYGIIVFVIYLYFIALLVKKCVCFYKSNSVFLIPYITSLCIFFSITMVGHLLLYTSYFNLLILFWSSIEAYIYGCKDSSHIQEHNTSNNKMLCIY